jgi:hypothetical protein
VFKSGSFRHKKTAIRRFFYGRSEFNLTGFNRQFVAEDSAAKATIDSAKTADLM